MQIIWTGPALADRNKIYSYVETHNPRAALALDQKFAEKAQILTRHPYIGRPSATPDTRELVVHPNYVLFYTVDPAIIRIIRLKHVAQRFP